jgi:hypothetical protein
VPCRSVRWKAPWAKMRWGTRVRKRRPAEPAAKSRSGKFRPRTEVRQFLPVSPANGPLRGGTKSDAGAGPKAVSCVSGSLSGPHALPLEPTPP